MIAGNRIRCTVVAVPLAAEFGTLRGALTRDLLPWADPYVAQLIRKLQDEVRQERRERSLVQCRSKVDFFSPPARQATQLGGQEK
jgi:hypothetical protein